MERLVSFLGLFVMMGLALLMSSNRRRVSLRIVTLGLLLQFTLAILILKTDIGRGAFQFLGDRFTDMLRFVDVGAGFVFGEKTFEEHYFAFKVLPTIIFFSALMSVLYHVGVMQAVVRASAWVMQRTLGTSGAETLSAAANIFAGQTEAPLVVKPYVKDMTLSELNAVMVVGFATISGGVLAAFVGMKIDAVHLMSASVISAPAGLLIAKILEPEVDEPKTLGKMKVDFESPAVNVIDAAALGATDGVRMAINVAAMIIAFLALIAMADALVAAVGSWFGWQWSLTGGFGYLFAPMAWLMGMEWRDCLKVGELLGVKMVTNEFVAYRMLAEGGGELTERSRLLTTYALCGFANFSSIGIQIGGIGAMAPGRQGDLARLGLRAMLGGNLACFMTAGVAGVII